MVEGAETPASLGFTPSSARKGSRAQLHQGESHPRREQDALSQEVCKAAHGLSRERKVRVALAVRGCRNPPGLAETVRSTGGDEAALKEALVAKLPARGYRVTTLTRLQLASRMVACAAKVAAKLPFKDLPAAEKELKKHLKTYKRWGSSESKVLVKSKFVAREVARDLRDMGFVTDGATCGHRGCGTDNGLVLVSRQKQRRTTLATPATQLGSEQVQLSTELCEFQNAVFRWSAGITPQSLYTPRAERAAAAGGA